MMEQAQWMATIVTDDGATVHVMFEDKQHMEEMKAAIEAEFGSIDDAWTEALVPLTWECDGRDGCHLQA